MGLLTRHPKDRTTTYPGESHPGFWTSSRKWGILRVITIIALSILLVGINSAIDKWKRDETGGRDGNMADGVIQYNLPHTSFRDYSHRGLQHATNYFMNHRGGAEVLGRTRDAVLCLQGLFVLILIYRHHAFGCRFIVEFFIYIVLREFATIMFWEPIPEDAVYPPPSKIDADTDHFFSGHVCTSLLLTIELIRASHPYRLPIRFGVAFLMYTISLFVTIVQLILRVHYFADIYCSFFVAHLICATYHLLELHHHIPHALMDETGDGHIAGPNTKGARRSSASDTDGHMQQTNAHPVGEYGHTFPASQSYRPTMQYGVEPHERAMDNIV